MSNRIDNLTVISDNAGVFTDHSLSATSFIKDKFIIEAGEQLYVGFYKPISSFYAEISVPTTDKDGVTYEYYNGTAWVELNLADGTNGLTRSGFLNYNIEDSQEIDINGETNHYIRITHTEDVCIVGIGCLFSDDCLLQEEYFEVVDPCLFPTNFNSHILSHVSARNHIMQLLRNAGHLKHIPIREDHEDHSRYSHSKKNDERIVTCFDLLDKTEVALAATYLALSTIFFRMADNQDSIEWDKYKEYQDRFQNTFKSIQVTLDVNDNGIKDDDDDSFISGGSFTWRR